MNGPFRVVATSKHVFISGGGGGGGGGGGEGARGGGGGGTGRGIHRDYIKKRGGNYIIIMGSY